jgi:hypothetical protein
MNTISTATLSHRDAHAIAFAQAASTMFAMDPMLRHRPDHLKMPRQDAYNMPRYLALAQRLFTRAMRMCAM